jgi:hypothetical protein
LNDASRIPFALKLSGSVATSEWIECRITSFPMGSGNAISSAPEKWSCCANWPFAKAIGAIVNSSRIVAMENPNDNASG